MRRFQITRCDGDTLVITHIFNWIVDKKPPRIRCPGDINLGCNPVAIPAPDPEKLEVDDDCCLDTVFWLQDIIVSNTGCKQERLRQYGAIDCCSNRALCEQKITWISDMTPPEIIRCPEGKY